MRNVILVVAGLLCVSVGTLEAAPAIKTNGIVNAASLRPVGIPGSGIARGSLFAIFGTGLGPPLPGVEVKSFPLQTTLGNVSVRVTGSGGAGVDAIPVFVFDGQVNAIMPSNAPLGQVSITVRFQNETSPGATAQVLPASFGIFAYSGGLGVVQNFLADGSVTLNTPSNSARRGQIMIAYGTGLGAINAPDNVAPPTGDIDVPVEILVGGRPARKLYAGRSPCCSGLDQIVFEVAEDTPTGCYVPMTIKAGDFYSNFVTIAMSASGGACSDEGNPLSGLVTSGAPKTVGVIGLSRTSISISFLGQTLEGATDTASGAFFRVGETFYNSQYSAPPLGTCTVLTPPSTSDINPLPVNLLDAGTPLRINGPNGEKQMPRGMGNAYAAMLGGGLPIPGAPPPPPLYLSAGRYTITGPGGANVGAFTANVDLPPALEWTNRAQITTVNRSEPLRITWSGGNPSREIGLILGLSTDSNATAAGYFICVVPLAPGSFTIPAPILSSLPVSGSQSGISLGTLLVGTTLFGSGLTTFTASGIDLGVVSWTSGTGKPVDYR